MRVSLRGLLYASASVTALLLVATVHAAPVPAPFIETFDSRTGNLHGLGPWTTNGVEDASAVAQTTDKIGAKGASTDMADLTLNVAGTPNNIWCQIYAKPTLYNDSENGPGTPAAEVSAAFYVNESGLVKAYSGNKWVPVGDPVETDGRWLAFAVHSDYSDGGSWNLYVSDDGLYGTTYRRLNKEPLAFRNETTATALTKVTVSGIAKIDEVYLAKAARAPSNTGSKLYVTAMTLTGGTQTATGIQPHFYGVGKNNIHQGEGGQVGGELGDDLLVWLESGDYITVRDPLDKTYKNDVTGWALVAGEGSATVYAGSGVWITKDTTGAFVMFSDYDTLTAQLRPVVGTDTAAGMNFLAWDKPTESLSLGTSHLTTPGAAAGFGSVAGTKDRLYVYRNGQLRMLYWDNVNKRWMDGVSGASDTLRAGETFWYYRGSASGSGAWNLPGAL